MFFRSLRLGVGFLAGTLPLLLSAQIELQRVWPGYRTAESFTTLAEYFGGPVSATNQATLRTQPLSRDGYYWLTRTNSHTAYPASTIRLEITRQGATEPSVYSFDWDVPKGSHAVFVGLTGTDWADPTAVPVAWRLSFLAPSGKLLTSTHSFLWNQTDS